MHPLTLNPENLVTPIRSPQTLACLQLALKLPDAQRISVSISSLRLRLEAETLNPETLPPTLFAPHIRLHLALELPDTPSISNLLKPLLADL
jgi:hypothetical protein